MTMRDAKAAICESKATEHKSARFRKRPLHGLLAESGSRRESNLKDYSSALAYELISQLRSISSCCGVVHSMGAP